ncbi:MAG: hypothetical protein LAP38_02565 [Acidobacteriia bacterium]|nr:hypothetical protein [Terriglobia bacterium]
MTSRFFVPFSAAALLAAPILLHAQAPAAKPAAKPAPKRAWTTPRTSGGHPDLQGIWTNATITRMERLPEFNGKLDLTDAEAAAFEAKDHQDSEEEPGKDGVILGGVRFSGANAGYNALFIDRGNELARVDGKKRSSLIIDPSDGKVPPRVPGSGGRFGRGGAAPGGPANVKNRPISERCILGFGSTSGPPMLPVLYNNNYQIVETPNTVMIMVEMIHDVRVVRIGGTHKPPEIRQWLGDSIGHWEGDTLVVDTTNFSGQAGFYGSGQNLHIIERFQRVDQNTILYRVTLDDPSTWTKPWTMEYPFVAAKGPIYEYACHEGNYAMEDILGGASKQDSGPTRR